MVLSNMVPHFPAVGSGGVPPVPPTILMSVPQFFVLNCLDMARYKVEIKGKVLF